MKLIPSIDLRRGQVVRLHQGDDAQRTVYDRDPRMLLASFAAAAVPLAHVVDLDAAFGEPPQRALIAALVEAASGAGPAIELGGGLRTAEDVGWALRAGCRRVVLGSLAVGDPEAFEVLTQQFPDRLVPALEVKDGALKVAGWRASADVSVASACARLRGLPCPAVLVTDVSRDGTLAGPNLALAREIGHATGFDALVSGGVRSLADLRAVAADDQVAGVVVGKALFDGRFDLAGAVLASRPAQQEAIR